MIEALFTTLKAFEAIMTIRKISDLASSASYIIDTSCAIFMAASACVLIVLMATGGTICYVRAGFTSKNALVAFILKI